MQGGSVAGFPYPFQRQIAVSADRTLTTRDLNGVIVVDSSAGPVTITLPRAIALKAGALFYIVATTGETNPVFIAVQAGDTYNAALTVPIEIDLDGGTVQVLGTNSSTSWLAFLGTAHTHGTATTREIFLMATDYAANRGDFRARTIGATGAFRFTFWAPGDFVSIVSLELVGIPDFTNPTADVDLSSDYGAVGELFTNHSETDTTSTFAFVDDTISAVDLSSVFSSLTAGDFCGVEVDHNTVGGTVDYLGIKMVYNVP